jgi:Family of unknown function (DUF5681)
MSKGERRRSAASRQHGSGAPSSAKYRVGYGKPPREHRFKAGQSGNRKGRPKGAKTTATLLRELLDRKIEVRTGGMVRKISLREAMLTRFAEAALKGDTKSAAFLLQRYDALEETGTAQPRGALPCNWRSQATSAMSCAATSGARLRARRIGCR